MAVGTKADKTMVESDISSFTVDAPLPVENPQISSMSKAALPALSWENNCNTSFTVWFGNNADFADPATKKKALNFTMKDPNGNFSITLKPKEWLTIRNLVGDATGSTIYWYVEAEDVLGRPDESGVMSFLLTD
jgi:hypothetical protein